MTPDLLLAAIKSGFEFGTELVKFWQTPEGQKQFAQMRADQAKWDAFWAPFGEGVQKLIKGELFK